MQRTIKGLRIKRRDITTRANSASGHVQPIKTLITYSRQEFTIRSTCSTDLSGKANRTGARTNTHRLLVRQRIGTAEKRAVKGNISVIRADLHGRNNATDRRASRQGHRTGIALRPCGNQIGG